MKRTLSLLLALCFMTLSLSGCKDEGNTSSENPSAASESSASGEAAKIENGGILKNATGGKIGTINPFVYKLAGESEVAQLTSMKLYAFFPSEDGTTFELKGEAASEPPIKMDEEGKVWQIKLHDNMKWANGDVLNADDFMYTWKMCLDPVMVNSSAGNLFSDFINIKGAEEYALQGANPAAPVSWESVGLKKIDDLTLEVTAMEPHDAQEVMMHFANVYNVVVHDGTYEKCMNEDKTENLYGTSAENYMSCGKFILESWVRDAEFVYKKNPDYVYADSIKVDGKTTKVVSDAGTRMQLFEKGELDYISLSAQDKKKYEQDPRTLLSPANSVVHVCINTVNPQQPILANINFRKALYYGTDRKTIAKFDVSKPANYMVPTTHVIDSTTGKLFRDTDAGKANIEPDYSYNPEKAVEYFNKALEEEGLKSVTIRFSYADSETARVRTEFLQKSWTELFGKDRFTLKLEAMPTKQLSDLRKKWKTDPACYELSWSSWSGADTAPWNALKFWKSDHPTKNEPFMSEEYDALFDRANYGEDRFQPGVREECVAKMEKILLDNVVMIPVLQGQDAILKNEHYDLHMKNWANKIGYAWEFGHFNS